MGFILLWAKKGKELYFSFLCGYDGWGRLKTPCPDNSEKKWANNLTRINKTHHRKGELQTESKSADDEGEMQTHHLRLCLSACMPVCLSVSLPDCLSVCLPFTLPILQGGIYPASLLQQQLQPILTFMLQIRDQLSCHH